MMIIYKTLKKYKGKIFNIFISLIIILLVSLLISGEWKSFWWGVWFFIGVNLLIVGSILFKRRKEFIGLIKYGDTIINKSLKGKGKGILNPLSWRKKNE